jgi:hypothetical protein
MFMTDATKTALRPGAFAAGPFWAATADNVPSAMAIAANSGRLAVSVTPVLGPSPPQ